jgi:hypothetical protein
MRLLAVAAIGLTVSVAVAVVLTVVLVVVVAATAAVVLTVATAQMTAICQGMSCTSGGHSDDFDTVVHCQILS